MPSTIISTEFAVKGQKQESAAAAAKEEQIKMLDETGVVCADLQKSHLSHPLHHLEQSHLSHLLQLLLWQPRLHRGLSQSHLESRFDGDAKSHCVCSDIIVGESGGGNPPLRFGGASMSLYCCFEREKPMHHQEFLHQKESLHQQESLHQLFPLHQSWHHLFQCASSLLAGKAQHQHQRKELQRKEHCFGSTSSSSNRWRCRENSKQMEKRQSARAEMPCYAW